MWGQFFSEILHRLSPSGTSDIVDCFNAFRQHNLSIGEFMEQFEKPMAKVQEDNPNLFELWFVRCCVNGMRSTIKLQLRPLRPENPTDAFWSL